MTHLRSRPFPYLIRNIGVFSSALLLSTTLYVSTIPRIINLASTLSCTLYSVHININVKRVKRIVLYEFYVYRTFKTIIIFGSAHKIQTDTDTVLYIIIYSRPRQTSWFKRLSWAECWVGWVGWVLYRHWRFEILPSCRLRHPCSHARTPRMKYYEILRNNTKYNKL